VLGAAGLDRGHDAVRPRWADVLCPRLGRAKAPVHGRGGDRLAPPCVLVLLKEWFRV